MGCQFEDFEAIQKCTLTGSESGFETSAYLLPSYLCQLTKEVLGSLWETVCHYADVSHSSVQGLISLFNRALLLNVDLQC